MTEAETKIRDMIADRLNEYQMHRAAANAYLRSAEDPSCGCDPDECECSEQWDRGEYTAAAQAEATLAGAAATAMTGLVAFLANTKS